MGRCVSKCLKSTVLSDSIDVPITDNDHQTEIVSPEIIDAAKPVDNKQAVRIVQNFTLLWLDSKIDENNIDFKNSLTQLRTIVNTINAFTNSDECIHFLDQITDEKAFMLISGSLSQSIIPCIHQAPQLESVYIFCANKSKYEPWASEWPKIKGIFTDIESICEVLKRDAQQCNQDSVTISVTSKNVDRLEPSFMYTQLIKEVLLEMEYDEKAKTELVEFCREQFHNNPHE